MGTNASGNINDSSVADLARVVSKRMYVARVGSGMFSEAWVDGEAVEYTGNEEHNNELLEDVAVAVAEVFWPLNITARWGWHLKGEEAPAACPKGYIIVKSSDIMGV